MVKACIFDFDGVLVDSEKYHHLAWEWIAAKIGTTISYDEYAPMKSAGRRTVIPYLFAKAGLQLDEQTFDKYSALRSEYAAKALANLNESDVMSGVVDYLKLLKSKGYLLAVASASTASGNVAKRFGLYDYLDVFVDGNANLPPKPNPDIYLAAASKLGVQASQCVVFEDSLSGVAGAKKAGMKCIGFQTYFTNIADVIIDSFVGLSDDILY